MSILLFVVGAIVFAAGAAMVGYGIPINEFSFGNTLIIAGTTAVVGGLIVIGLGIAVLSLRRIADALALRPAARASRPPEAFEPATAPAGPAANPARVPFPTKRPVAAKADAGLFARPITELRPEPLSSPPEIPLRQPDYVAPTLVNPVEVAVEEEVSLSPQHPVAPSEQAVESDAPAERVTPPFFRRNEPEPDAADSEPPSFEARRQPPPPPRKAPTTYFDAMWPARSKPAEPEQPKSVEPPEEMPVEADIAERGRDASDRDDIGPSNDARAVDAASQVESEPASEREADDDLAELPAEKPPAPEPQPVAILKSGVVDGMGYTLYVDGSIEAELPQGTLRFASINELRSHLERTS